MAKADKSLPIQSRSLNRRALLRGGSLTAAAAAAASVAPSVAQASVALPKAEPTELGRELLRRIRAHVATLTTEMDVDAKGGEASERSWGHYKETADAIISRRGAPTTPAHLVDLAILARFSSNDEGLAFADVGAVGLEGSMNDHENIALTRMLRFFIDGAGIPEAACSINDAASVPLPA